MNPLLTTVDGQNTIQLFAAHYSDGFPAIIVKTMEGEPYLTLSTNLPHHIGKGNKELWVLDSDSFRRLADELVNVGVLADNPFTTTSGFNKYISYSIAKPELWPDIVP